MSLRWSSCVAPKPPTGVQKRKTDDFRLKSHFAWRKFATKFLGVKAVSGKVVRHSLAQLSVQKWLVGGDPFYLKFWIKLTAYWSEIADFRSIFARSISAVTPSEKVQLTLIGSPLRAFQWGQDEHRTLSLSPQRVAPKCKVSKIWTTSCDNSETVRDGMSVTINH